MSLRSTLNISRFVISCLFLTGYTAYTVYAVYYYRTFGNALSIVLLALIVASFVLSALITFISYRINLKGAPRPTAHRFIKMAKYLLQLLCSGLSLSLVLSAVHNLNWFSLLVAAISIPFLLWGLFVNVLTEYIDHKFRIGLGKRYFVPTVPRDRHGNPVDLTEVIARVDGVKAAKEMMAARLPQCGGTDKKN